ncbi:isopeptide-forming domain-containing fimbrial protein [Schaalia sp. JY-X169]|uniref:DUF7927 domain-containing protein n=1 Tax=Schaalia sp. JY-X169 TaxID=2758572 RepID=UPI0015F4D956|nr:isopeptide-forming domain-containing fimbrial protein [Schaalia sp. JY-X169]
MRKSTSHSERKLRKVRTEVAGRSPRRVFAAYAGVVALLLMGVVPAASAVEDPGSSEGEPPSSGTSSGDAEELLAGLSSDPQLSVASASTLDQPQSRDSAPAAQAAVTPQPLVAPAPQSEQKNAEPAGDQPESGGTQADPPGGTDPPEDADQQSKEDPQSDDGQAQSGTSRLMLSNDPIPLADAAATVTVTTRTFGPVGSVTPPQVSANMASTAGANYELYTVISGQPGTATGLTCTVQAATPGSCVIEVPAGQDNQAYYVVQTGAATGTYFNPVLNLGNSTTPNRDTNYPGLTPNLTANKAVQMPAQAVDQFGSSNPIAMSFGAAVNSISNPVLQARCEAGVNIAVVLDVSGSMDTNVQGYGTRLAMLKSTFNDTTNGILAALNGSPTKLAFFNFATNSPASGNTNGWNAPVPVAVTDANIASLRAKINGLSASNFTNWDQALRAVADANSALGAADKYDVVVFVTDGAPNYILGSNGSGGQAPNGANVTLRSMEAPIYRANDLKSQNVRVIGYGIAQGSTGADKARQNLRAISGVNPSSDYFVAEADALREYLRSLFGSLACNVPITVEKYTPGATAGSWTPKSGWNMGVDENAGSDGTMTDPASTLTNASGKAGPWTLNFTSEMQRGAVTVTEEDRTGWQTASPATYTISNIITGSPENTVNLPANGVIGDLKAGDQVTVKFYNEEITTPSIAKSFTSVAQGTGDQFLVNYLVTVTGANQALSYDLGDVPKFAPGVTLVSGSAQQIDNPTDHNSVGPERNIPLPPADGKFVTGVALPANGVHYYHVQWAVTVDNDEVAGHTECVPQTPNEGYFNSAQLYVAGQDTQEATACGPITPAVIPAVTKTVDSGFPAQNADGTWDIKYTVTVTLPTNDTDNPNHLNGTYSLTDTLKFGAGISVVNASWTRTGTPGGSFTGNNAVMATDQMLAFTSPVHVYNVTVKASINPAQINDTTDVCLPQGDSGFFNHVLLTSAGVDREDTACAPPVLTSPTVAKTASTSTKNADGSWKISYNITVTNTSSTALNYSLSDDAATPPTSASWQAGSSWAKSSPVVAPVATGGTATVAPGWNGTGVLATGKIGGNATHTFTVSRNAVLDPDGEYDYLHCEPGVKTTGFWNSATVTNGVTTDDPAEACAQILTPRINVEKGVASVNQTAVDSWTVVYDVTVKNTGNMPGSFGLTDVPNFGAGFTITSQGWLGDPADAPGSGDADNYILNGQTLTYQYEVVASFDPEVLEPGLVCEADPDDAGAFMNQINLESDSGPDSDHACADPLSPTVTKTLGSVTQDQDTGDWTVTYNLVVAAPSGGKVESLAYSLSDTLAGLPTGVARVGTPTVTGPTALNGGTFTAASPAWSGAGAIGTGTLPVGQAHAFTVTQVVSVGAGAVPGNLECEAGTPTKGIINQATVTNGVGGNSDEACGSLEVGSWTLVKSSNPTSGSTVTPGSTITYTLTVNNPSETAVTGVVVTDDLSDVVNNATLNTAGLPAGVTYSAASQTLTWAAGTLAAGATKTVSYTVTVNPDAYGVTLRNVATGDGSVPPETCPTDSSTCSTIHGTDPAWTLAKTANPPSGTTVEPGDTITYTLSATSMSKDKAVSDVEVTDDLTAVVAYADLGALPAGLTYNADTKVLTWDVGTLTAGTTKTISYSVTVKADAYGVTIRNLATGSGSVPPQDCSTASRTCTTTHDTDPAWSLVKSSDPESGSTVEPGDTITYTVTATSLSKVKALYGLVVVDDLSEVLDHAVLDESDLPADALYDPVDQILTWNVGPLQAGADKVLTYRVTVNEDAVGVHLTNVVTEGAEVPPPVPCPAGSADCRTTEHDTDPAWSLVKSSDPESGSTVDPGSEITYTLTATNLSLETALEGYVAVDDLSDVLNNAVLDEDGLPAGVTYDAATQRLTWAVPTLEAGSSADVSYTVTVNGDAVGVILRNAVTEGGETPPPVDCPAEDLDCRTTEHYTPQLTVSKRVIDATQNEDGTWTVRYDVTVANIAGFGTTYSLTDTLQFGDGITVDSATWDGQTSGTFVGSSGALAVDEPIGDGIPYHSYRVTANATVEPDAWSEVEAQLACPAPESSDKGGFLNTAALTYPGSQEEAQACTEPGLPTVAKAFESATQSDEDPTQWQVAYTLTVTGDGQWPTVYSLKDVPGFAEGATPTGGTWQRTDTDPASPPETIGADGQIADGVEIDAETTHTYRVIWTVDVPNGVDPDVQECKVPGEAGNGFFNEAILTSGGVEQTDDACGPIDTVVRPSVAKTVTGLVQNDDGSWDVTYDVVVTLPTGEEVNPKGLSAKYDLVDVLDFGASITIQAATWSGGGLVDQPFVDGSAEMASGAVITPEDAVHTYTVTVSALVDNEAFVDGSAYCEPESETGSGFLNRVTLISAGTPSEDQACTEPPAPEWTLEKTSDPASGSTVKAGDKVTYTLKVTNSSDEADLHGAVVKDDLSDVLKHAALSGDLAAGLSVDGSTLTWAVPVVAKGESVQVSYTVTVKKDAVNVQLKNVATPDSPGGVCTPDKCSTTHKVPPTPTPTPTPPTPRPPALPRTGATVGSILLGGLVLGAIGYGLKRRSRMGA